MLRISFTFTALLVGTLAVASPVAHAEEPRPESEGLSLIQRGFSLLLEGFRQDSAPAFERLEEDMSTLTARLGPVLRDMAAQIDDIRNYEMPERLENGDILIRRREDAPPPPAFEPPTPSAPRDPSRPEISL